MKTAGIVIDAWKLDIFQRHLEKAGYVADVGPGLTPDTLLLRIQFDEEQSAAAAKVVRAANDEAARFKFSKLQ